MLIAQAQFRPRKGDYAGNLRRIGGVLAQVGRWPEPPGLVLFGETATSGYFLEGGAREAAVTAGTLYRDLAAQHKASGAPPLDVSLGFYERHQARVFNAALYATLGGPAAGIVHVHRKVFLPTYGMFDEERFVDAGTSVQAFDTAWGRAAILICEDAWHSVTGTLAALDGARLLIVPSASPGRGVAPTPAGTVNNVETWERVMRRLAEEHGVYVALTHIVGFEGGKGFFGRSLLVSPDGEVRAAAPVFDEAVIRGVVDRRALVRARYEQPLLGDLEVSLPALLQRARRGRPEPLRYDPAEGQPAAATRTAVPDLPVVEPEETADPLAIDPELAERWLVRFLREEVVVRRGYRQGLVALSGGVDSAVTAALAARALGAENVIGVRLPHRTSSPDSMAHAEQIARWLGIRMETVDITEAVEGLYAAAHDEGDGPRRGNAMARMRMIVMFDLSARHHALPLGTGNKSERLLGYFTWHADDAPPVNPLGDLFKTQVLALARHLRVPDEIVDKPATADLVAGQTDEGDLGITYPRADRILWGLVSGYEPDEVAAMGFTDREITLVRDRLERTHWKRRLPTVAMLSGTTIGESYLRPVDYGPHPAVEVVRTKKTKGTKKTKKTKGTKRTKK
jgi:NAD+ synthetase